MCHEENEWGHIIQNTSLVPFSSRKNEHIQWAREQHIRPLSVDWDAQLRKLTVCGHMKEDVFVCEEAQQVHSGSRAIDGHTKLSVYISDVAPRCTSNQYGNRFLLSIEANCKRMYPIRCIQKVLNQRSSSPKQSVHTADPAQINNPSWLYWAFHNQGPTIIRLGLLDSPRDKQDVTWGVAITAWVINVAGVMWLCIRISSWIRPPSSLIKCGSTVGDEPRLLWQWQHQLRMRLDELM